MGDVEVSVQVHRTKSVRYLDDDLPGWAQPRADQLQPLHSCLDFEVFEDVQEKDDIVDRIGLSEKRTGIDLVNVVESELFPSVAYLFLADVDTRDLRIASGA